MRRGPVVDVADKREMALATRRPRSHFQLSTNTTETWTHKRDSQAEFKLGRDGITRGASVVETLCSERRLL